MATANNEFFEALSALEKERGLPEDYLIDKIKAEQIPVVYYLELSSHSTARVIGEETGAKPMLLHSCHNVTRREFDQGITYLQLMKRNVEALRAGLD